MIRAGHPALVAALLGIAGIAASCGSAPPPPLPQPSPNAADPRQPEPPPVEPTAVAAPRALAKVERLGNGLNVVLLPHRRGTMAQVQVGLLAGADFVAPGLAELAAEVFVGSADATANRVSLRQVTANLGGTLTIEVNPLSTWITFRVPEFSWARLQEPLRAALSAPTISRPQIDRLRDELVVARIREVWERPEVEIPRAFRLGFGSTANYVAALLERDPSEVSLFVSRLYRPESTILALDVPGARPAVMKQVQEGVGRWPLATTARQAVDITERRLETGLYWAPAAPAPLCRAMLVLPLPDLGNTFAAELFVLHACLTLDGVGGRLEQLQRENGLDDVAWESAFVDLADVPALVLTTTTAPEKVPQLFRIAQAARLSFAELPPTPSELQLALRRARLTAQLLTDRASARGRAFASSAMRREASDRLERRFAVLGQPGRFPAEGAAKIYLREPAAMIALGATPPDDLPEGEFTSFDLLPPGALARLVSDDPEVQAIAASPWLDRAIEAAGGRTLLGQIRGARATSTLQSAAAPAIEQTIEWRAQPLQVTRTRDVLGTRIATSIGKNEALETSGGKEVPVPPREVALLRRELQRHPIALLAATVRGELAFRPLAQRTVGDRDLMVLEAVGDAMGFDRLRIHIDIASHLIRAVEAWETAANGSLFHVRDAWSDYRMAGGARAPFRRLTEHDAGQNRIECVYSSWEPLLER